MQINRECRINARSDVIYFQLETNMGNNKMTAHYVEKKNHIYEYEFD